MPADAMDGVLKDSVLGAFEHACMVGDIDVADQLLAIIRANWRVPVRDRGPSRPARQPGPGTRALRGSMVERPRSPPAQGPLDADAPDR